MKFRKKPVVIDATEFHASEPCYCWPPGVVAEVDSSTGFAIDTLEGRALEVSDGDWIITGVKGERYPCKPDVFAATYEPAESLTSEPDAWRHWDPERGRWFYEDSMQPQTNESEPLYAGVRSTPAGLTDAEDAARWREILDDEMLLDRMGYSGNPKAFTASVDRNRGRRAILNTGKPTEPK